MIWRKRGGGSGGGDDGGSSDDGVVVVVLWCYLLCVISSVRLCVLSGSKRVDWVYKRA